MSYLNLVKVLLQILEIILRILEQRKKAAPKFR